MKSTRKSQSNPGPTYCPNELTIDSWKFMLKNPRFDEWTWSKLSDIPDNALLILWRRECELNPGHFITDKIQGEVIRRSLIGSHKPNGTGKKRYRKKKRRRIKTATPL